MARVITFSRYFPSYHYRKGEETFFVEKFMHAMSEVRNEDVLKLEYELGQINSDVDNLIPFFNDLERADMHSKKFHTIRKGRRWKVGDYFSPRVWSEDPYKSKQIKIGPDTEIKKVWDVEIFTSLGCIYIGIKTAENQYDLLSFGEVAKNDGLTFEEMKYWFNVTPDKPFIGQIICWSDQIEY